MFYFIFRHKWKTLANALRETIPGKHLLVRILFETLSSGGVMFINPDLYIEHWQL